MTHRKEERRLTHALLQKRSTATEMSFSQQCPRRCQSSCRPAGCGRGQLGCSATVPNACIQREDGELVELGADENQRHRHCSMRLAAADQEVHVSAAGVEIDTVVFVIDRLHSAPCSTPPAPVKTAVGG